MMNIDQARAGGEGMLSSPKKKKDKEVKDGPDLFQSDEKELKVAIPEGWRAEG